MNPVERFKRLSYGELAAVCQKVTLAGGDGDDVVERVLRDEVKIILEGGRVDDIFTPPEEQVERVLEFNEVLWKDSTITEAAIREAGDPQECPSSDEKGLYCVCLFSETGDATMTFARNWLACRFELGRRRTWKWDELKFIDKGVRQRPGALVRTPGLRWQICELGRHFEGQCVRDVRPQLDKVKTMGIGQELPFLAALHPNWAVSMNGDDIPYVDAPDLDVSPNALGRFGSAPCLDFNCDLSHIGLGAGRVDDPLYNYGSGYLQECTGD